MKDGAISIIHLESWYSSYKNELRRWSSHLVRCELHPQHMGKKVVSLDKFNQFVHLMHFHHLRCAYLLASNYISECLWRMAVWSLPQSSEPGTPMFTNYFKSRPKCHGSEDMYLIYFPVCRTLHVNLPLYIRIKYRYWKINNYNMTLTRFLWRDMKSLKRWQLPSLT